MPIPGLAAAIAEWRNAIGESNVVTAPAPCAAAETATFATSGQVPAILRPQSRSEVQVCLRIAGRHGVPVHPVSGGKNWGYGSRAPFSGACALLDLVRMDRILEYDEKLAYVTLEPGVTFRAVEAFLRARGSDLMLGTPGSTPDASIIGNALERGIANGPNGERAGQVCALEVVLPDGGIVETGLAGFRGATAAPLVLAGPGPGIDSLFFQSNFGVVTRLTHWLTPRPAFQQFCAFTIRRPDRLAELVDALQMVKREGLVEVNIALHNAIKILSYSRRAPAGRVRTPADLPADLAALLDGGSWFGETTVTAQSEMIGRAKRDRLAETLAGVADGIRFGAPDARNAMLGGDGASGTASVYWRKPEAVSGDDPDRDRCGVLWLCPLAPFDGAAVARCTTLLEREMGDAGFDPVIGVQCHSPRVVHVVGSILYDRDRPGEDARALACHDALLAELVAAGFVPYRLATPAMAALGPLSGGTGRLLAAIKAAVDPAHILAAGRYAHNAARQDER